MLLLRKSMGNSLKEDNPSSLDQDKMRGLPSIDEQSHLNFARSIPESHHHLRGCVRLCAASSEERLCTPTDPCLQQSAHHLYSVSTQAEVISDLINIT